MSVFDFFKPDHLSKDPEVRLKSVEKISDQDVLTDLAKNDNSPRVRDAAVTKISNQEKLMEIALDGKEVDSRIAAVERIESQEKLAHIIKVRKNFKLTGACLSLITDTKILEDIARDKEYSMSVRRMAIENFADEAFIEEVAEKKEEEYKVKSLDEIKALIEKYGGARLVRALGKFRGSKGSLESLGEILSLGGESAAIALEYLVLGLTHANPDIRKLAEDKLSTIDSPELITHLVRLMEKAAYHDKIFNVLKRIDHPDAKQIVEGDG